MEKKEPAIVGFVKKLMILDGVFFEDINVYVLDIINPLFYY